MSEQNNTLDSEESELRAAAAEADQQGMTFDELSVSGESSGEYAAPAETAEANEENIDAEESGESGGPGNNGNVEEAESETGTVSAENPEANAEEEKAGDKPDETKLTKEQKEEARKEKSWKKLEEEKAAFLREKAEFEASKLGATGQASSENPAQNPVLLAESFESLAKQFEESGDFDKAVEARDKAAFLKAQTLGKGGGQPRQVDHPARHPQFQKAWSASIERAVNDFPEMKDPNSDFGKTVKSILNDPDAGPYLSSMPHGGYVAAQLANLKGTALKVPVLEKEIAALKAENKQLRQQSSLPEAGGYDRSSEGGKDFGRMSLEQQEALLRKEAERSDGAPSKSATFI